MFPILITGRQRIRLKPLSASKNYQRFISSFFKDNIQSLFGAAHDQPDQKQAFQVKIKPIQKAVSTLQFYSQFHPPTHAKVKEIVHKSQNQAVSKIVSQVTYDYYAGVRNRPEVGSFVEVQKDDGAVVVGIVETAQSGSFDEDLEFLTMLNIRGKLIRFKASQISFHIFKLIKPKVMENLTPSSKTRVIQFLKQFINSTKISRYNDRSLYSMAQAWFAKENSPVEVDLQKIIEMVQRYSNQRDDDQLGIEASMLAAHINICNDPINWMAMRCSDLNRSDSLVNFKYFSNSYKTIESLDIAMKLTDKHLKIIGEELKLNLQGKSEKADTPHMNSLIVLMKHYVIYPHRSLRQPLKVIWNHVKGSNDFTPSDIYEMLVKLGETDIHNTIRPTQTQDIYSKINPDHFHFLRQPTNQNAYTIPNLNDGETDIAISLEKTKVEWILQIHILDVASHLAPNSKLVESLLNKVTTVSFDTKRTPLFEKDSIQGFREAGSNNAITITIQYPLNENNAWEKAKLLSVNLTSLENLKTVNIQELNELVESQSEFLSFFRSRKTSLDNEDEDILMSSFKIIEMWCKNRSSQGSLSHTLPSKIIQDDELIDQSDLNYLKFLRKEINSIASYFFSEWSQSKKFPLLIHSQSTLPSFGDSIEVKPNKFSIPSYKASEYEQFALFPNPQGEISFNSYICGSKLLSDEVVSDQSLPHTSLGLPGGFIEIANPLNDLECVINQWQLINWMKQEFKFKEGYNYRLNKSLQDFKLLSSFELQQYYDYKIAPLKKFHKSLEAYNQRFLRLKWLSTKQNEWMIFKCIVTKQSTFPNLAQAYCFELGLDVEILLNPTTRKVQIGDQLICTKIVKLDVYIESRIILEL